MLINNIFNRRISLFEKSLIFFVLTSYLQVFIYSINLILPDISTSIFNVLRLFLVVVLLTDSLRIRSRFRFSPLILVALLLLTAIYIIPFALSSPIRLTSGLISFLPLILLVSCLAQSRVSYSIDNTILKGLIFHFRFLLFLSFVFCLINEYLWKVGLMPNKFGGALSFYGLLPRNTAFFSIPGTLGAFVFACLVLLCYFNTLTPLHSGATLNSSL